MAKKEGKEGFFSGVKAEAKQIIWPSKKNVIKFTIATVVMCIFFMLYFLLINLLSSVVKGLFI